MRQHQLPDAMMRKGFSLVELSIVLVILGLLTGGILAGQSLIRAAEIRSALADNARYLTAFQSFRDRYMALPGDMNNATKFWGAATCPGTLNTAGTGSATCDGNGDGRVTGNIVGTSNERYRAWQHLANAGMIEGQYSGVGAAAGNSNSAAGFNVPAARIANYGWVLTWTGVILSGPTLYDGDYGHTLNLQPAINGTGNTYDAFKPEELWNIDTKLDDGRPGYGRLRPYRGTANVGCTTSDTQNIAEYNLTNTALSCVFMYNNAI